MFSDYTIDILISLCIFVLGLCVYVWRTELRPGADADRWRESNYFGDRK